MTFGVSLGLQRRWCGRVMLGLTQQIPTTPSITSTTYPSQAATCGRCSSSHSSRAPAVQRLPHRDYTFPASALCLNQSWSRFQLASQQMSLKMRETIMLRLHIIYFIYNFFYFFSSFRLTQLLRPSSFLI